MIHTGSTAPAQSLSYNLEVEEGLPGQWWAAYDDKEARNYSKRKHVMFFGIASGSLLQDYK